MKYLSLLAIIYVFLISCDDNKISDVTKEISNELTELHTTSLEKWSELKATNGNSYDYETTSNSVFGFGITTKIKVKEGEVIARSYEEFEIDFDSGEKTITDSYEETEANLGDSNKGLGVFTIDDLYSSCLDKYLIADSEENTIYFEVETNGIMNLCGYVPIGCQDDCYSGIRISEFSWSN